MNKNIILLLTLSILIFACEKNSAPPVPEDLRFAPDGQPIEDLSEDDTPIGQAYYGMLSSNQISQGVKLDRGWNMLIWPSELGSKNVESVLSNTNGWWLVYDASDNWKIKSNPSINGAHRAFSEFKPNHKYYIYQLSSGYMRYSQNSSLAAPANIPSGRDCNTGWTGRHNTTGISNGDKRFLCWDGQWYAWSVGYKGSDLIKDTGWWFAKSAEGPCKKIGQFYSKNNTGFGDFVHFAPLSQAGNECPSLR